MCVRVGAFCVSVCMGHHALPLGRWLHDRAKKKGISGSFVAHIYALWTSCECVCVCISACVGERERVRVKMSMPGVEDIFIIYQCVRSNNPN